MRRHPREERTVVRGGDEAAAMPARALEQVEAREVEVVGRLVEQEHVGVGRQHRLECRLAASPPERPSASRSWTR